ncbi:MAG: hypothetical protein ACYSTT_13025 [Planctomycetota bacterium]|jgi:hypothetical protein
MKRFVFLLFCIFLAAELAGCRSPGVNGVEVTVDGIEQFPEYLVGTWKAEEGGWEFVFEPDGKISSAVVSIGRAKLQPGRTTTVLMQMGGKSIYKPGLWSVQYSHQQRELVVEIAIDYLHIELGEDTIEGRTREFFVGPVSTDGKSWWADLLSFPEYVVNTNKYQNYKLPFDPKNNPRESILFQKVPQSEQSQLELFSIPYGHSR